MFAAIIQEFNRSPADSTSDSHKSIYCFSSTMNRFFQQISNITIKLDEKQMMTMVFKF